MVEDCLAVTMREIPATEVTKQRTLRITQMPSIVAGRTFRPSLPYGNGEAVVKTKGPLIVPISTVGTGDGSTAGAFPSGPASPILPSLYSGDCSDNWAKWVPLFLPHSHSSIVLHPLSPSLSLSQTLP
uniref:Uncharacterized protein n=1 Tax=Opuntia streptacantha TaxID=393608 RepID=A0A7C8YP90_OPUST